MSYPHPQTHTPQPTTFQGNAQASMPYRFRLRKGEFELELSSDDPQFIAQQMEQWQHIMMHMSTPHAPGLH
ncbi:MAG: hypothetical protein ACKO37_09150 [Vampirovibrionales bacterium]